MDKPLTEAQAKAFGLLISLGALALIFGVIILVGS